ncbi:MAG TPA: hypothetical protein VHY20_08900 [Pirellulales bacterium]|nr:hypothetical protein [Pirellulales bacterium]
MSAGRCFRVLPLLLAVVFAAGVFCPPGWASEEGKPELTAGEMLALARQTGWQMCGLIVERLEPRPGSDFPGIAAWLKSYRELTKGIDSQQPPEKWPPLEIGELATHNPAFWRAYYEIAPGDPGLMGLHAGLLLSSGECSRALYVLVIAWQLTDVPKEVRESLDILAAHAQRMLVKGRAPLAEGIKLFDAGDREGAVQKYRQQLAIWPQDGWALYELGLTRFQLQELAAGRKPPALGSIRYGENGPAPTSEVLRLYAEAREHDPFQYSAYQGSDPDTVRRALAMFNECRLEWNKLAKSEGLLDRQVIERFSVGCQDAGVDELALVARQVVVARRGRYSPTDRDLISTSLRRLAPGLETEATIKRLAKPGELKLKQLVKPAAPEAPKP